MSSGMIGSQLRAYFPNAKLENEWNNYSTTLSDIFNLIPKFSSPCLRLEHVREIQTFLSASSNGTSELLLKKCNIGHSNVQNIQNTNFKTNLQGLNWKDFISTNQTIPLAFSHSWIKLKEIMTKQKDGLVQEILNSEVATF